MQKKVLIAIAIVMIFTVNAFAETVQNIILKPGFNFISFTADIAITPLQLKALNSAVADVYLYSVNAGGFLSLSEGTLTSLSKGKGYIVKIGGSSNVTFDVSGGPLAVIGDINLKAGFNLIGFSKVPIATTFVQLMNVSSAVKGMYKWSPVAGSFIQVIKNDSGVPVLIDGVDPGIKAGESYFINMSSDTTINYDASSIVIGGASIPITQSPAEISGILSTAVSAPEAGLNLSASGEEFNVTLLDSNGIQAPSSSLADGEQNPKIISDGQQYSFKVKDFTKSYKIIAQGKKTVNKMVSVFVGKVKENEKIINRDVNPVSTVMSLIYADATKDASIFASEESAKKNDGNFMKRLAPIVNELETRRASSLKNLTITDPAKLEAAYKDSVLGSTNVKEIEKIKEGLDLVIGKLEADLSILEKLKDALALIATNGKRQNETSLLSAKDKIKLIINSAESDPEKDAGNKSAYKEAKVAYGLVCANLGKLYSATASGGSSSQGAGRSLMANYQALSGKMKPEAKALFEEGYAMLKSVSVEAGDKASGLDKKLAAAYLKNASELAKEDPSKLNEAKIKADSLIARLNELAGQYFELPDGEIITKNSILEEKGNAFINGGHPAESVNIYKEITDQNSKNFGLGRAYMQLNSFDDAYRNLKKIVKGIVKSSNGFEARMQMEENFDQINEALFAFAAVMDKLRNGSEADIIKFKQEILAEEQGYSSEEKILSDPQELITEILKSIKPSTNFYEAGEEFINGQQTNFGEQYVDYTLDTEPVIVEFNKGLSYMLCANDIIENVRSMTSKSEREKAVYAGEASSGGIDNPSDATALKYLNDAIIIFEKIYKDVSVKGFVKGEAHFQAGLAYLSQYRALKTIDAKNKQLLLKAHQMFLSIKEKLADAAYAHLSDMLNTLICEVEDETNESSGIVSGSNALMSAGEDSMERARSLAYDGLISEASAAFETAYQKYYQAYSGFSTSEVKLREASGFFAARAQYDKYMIAPADNATARDVARRLLKILSIEFPDSSFAGSIREMLSALDSIFSVDFGEGFIAENGLPAPGVEYERAMALMEKLRIYYENNFSTSEIEQVFSDAEGVFRAIAFSLGANPDVKYVGTITGETELNHFKALAKFQLAILYMERYLMPLEKDVKYKNLALRYFNELIMNNTDEPFIFDVKNFVLTLQDEGRADPAYEGGKPVLTDVVVDPPSVIDGASDNFTINVMADVIIPSATASILINRVEAELKQFGNTIYADEAMSQPVKATLALRGKWSAQLIVPKTSVAQGNYDVVVTAYASNQMSGDAVMPFSVKPSGSCASITCVEACDANNIKVYVSGQPSSSTYTDVYLSVMKPDYSSGAEYDSKYVAVIGAAENIKLEKSTIETEMAVYSLDISSQLPALEAGSYMFMFKLVKYNPADPQTSLSKPVNTYPFNYYIEKSLAGEDKTSILKLFQNVLTIYNDKLKTAEQKIIAIEGMHALTEYKYPSGYRAALANFFSGVNDIKAAVEGEPYIGYSPDGLATLYASVKIEGVYNKNIDTGVFLPNGNMLLPLGATGSDLKEFYVMFEQSFTMDNGSWKLSGPSSNGESVIDDPSEILPPESFTKIIQVETNLPSNLTASSAGPLRAIDYLSEYSVAAVDADSASVELASGSISGSTFIVCVDAAKMGGKKLMIIVKKKSSGEIIYKCLIGKMPTLSEMPSGVNTIKITGLNVNAETTAKALLALEKGCVPDTLVVNMEEIAGLAAGKSIVIKDFASVKSQFEAELEKLIGGSPVNFEKVIEIINKIPSGLKMTIFETTDIFDPTATQILQAFVRVKKNAALLSSIIAVLPEVSSLLPESISIGTNIVDASTVLDSIEALINQLGQSKRAVKR